jgi:hypothetical protein
LEGEGFEGLFFYLKFNPFLICGTQKLHCKEFGGIE